MTKHRKKSTLRIKGLVRKFYFIDIHFGMGSACAVIPNMSMHMVSIRPIGHILH